MLQTKACLSALFFVKGYVQHLFIEITADMVLLIFFKNHGCLSLVNSHGALCMTGSTICVVATSHAHKAGLSPPCLFHEGGNTLCTFNDVDTLSQILKLLLLIKLNVQDILVLVLKNDDVSVVVTDHEWSQLVFVKFAEPDVER